MPEESLRPTMGIEELFWGEKVTGRVSRGENESKKKSGEVGIDREEGRWEKQEHRATV